MQPQFYQKYLQIPEYNKQKLLAVMNPEKLRALAFLLDLHAKRGYVPNRGDFGVETRSWCSATPSIH